MKYRTIWISDLHLGSRGCNATGLLGFLRETESEMLYLVGDVIDIWKLKRERYWPQSHNDVVQKILRKGRKGTHVVVIPGNHDEFCQNFLGVYGNVIIKKNAVHTTADGRRLAVLHGHEFDSVTTHARWMAVLGDIGYSAQLNRPLNALRSGLGLGYWSLSGFVKRKVKNAVSYVSDYEDAVARYARMHRADGIICGHIHSPAARTIRNVQYYNCGDWVESHTAIVELMSGKLELLHWRHGEKAVEEQLDLEVDVDSLMVSR
jgi:UDP-2,3-diacylglucosamine pyrophosphatase LpxH